MTSPTQLGPESPRLEGRSVRDIVEYSPEQVNDVWCRRIFRQILQSLELQYAMHMPRRAVTPDTIVFHENGEPLLIPLDIGPPDEREAEDLNALARVVHYAITQELVPAGPLQGRVEGYSAALLDAVDRSMDPDPARRPQTIDALRELLGIVPPGAPVRGASPDMASGLPADEPALPQTGAPAARLHEASSTVPDDRAHDSLPPTGAFLAGPSDADHAPARDTQAAADHHGVPDTGSATGQDDVHAAHPAPGHDGIHGIHDSAGGDTHTAPHVPGHEPAGEAQNLAGQAGVHATPHLPGHDATGTQQPAAALGAAHAAQHVAGGNGTHGTHDTHGASAVPHAAGPDRASDRTHGAGPAAAPVATPSARTIPPPPPGTRAATRRRAGLSSRQRWALAAGVAVFVALALATYSELRDSGPFEHIDLAAPPPADATRTLPDASAPAPVAQPGSDGAAAGSMPAVGGTAPGAATGAGVGAGLAPGETIVPGSTVPAPAAGTRPLPGVVVTPQGNIYKLQIQPWGVVYVDGVDSGVSPPVKRLTLAPGRHTIRITNPNFQERVFDVDTATGDGQISVDFTDTTR